MYLRELRLWNFRKYGSGSNDLDLGTPDLKIPFKEGLNLLIGENDSGKTAIVDAIKIALRTHSGEWIGLSEEDFYEDSTRLRIECEFFGFSDVEASNFNEWISWAGASPFLRVFVDVEKIEGRIMPYDIMAGLDPDGSILNAGAREFLKTTYLRPLRDAKSELIPRRNSRLSQILRAHPAFKNNSDDHHLLSEFMKFNTSIVKYFEGKKADNTPLDDQLGKELRDEIESYLDDFSEMTSLFRVSEADLKQILERLELTFAEQRNLGLGSHNILFISAELLHLNKRDWKGLRLGLIEEIEAHLHPQLQLQVIDVLQEKASIQLIITTHSPNIGSKINLEKLILCKDDEIYPMGKDHTQLAVTDYSYLRRFLDVTKANLFFAKGVILVEGWSEELLLPVLGKKVGVNLTSSGISIVNVGSTAFLRYSAIFKRRDGKELKLPVAVITDLDVIPSEESEISSGATETKGTIKQKEKEEKYSGGSVQTFVSPHWTLEYCIALSTNLREYLYQAIVLAGEEMTQAGYSGKAVTADWATFSAGKAPEVVAADIYNQLIGGGKRISKPIIAQNLAAILETLPTDHLTADQINADMNVAYLIKAINYASGSFGS